jgi:hypothetical protein
MALAVAVLIGLAVIGAVAKERQGADGLQAAGVAAFTCWFSATAALLLAGSLRHTGHSVSGILGGTLLRTMIPLAVAAVTQATGSPLAEAGLFGYLVLFFLLTLTIETLLLVWLLRPDLKMPAGKNRREAV